MGLEYMSELFISFDGLIHNKLGFELRKYQKHVAIKIIEALKNDSRLIIVSMPTGSGKTLIEIFTAYYGIHRDIPRILVEL